MSLPPRKPWETNFHSPPDVPGREIGGSRNYFLDQNAAAQPVTQPPPVPPRPTTTTGFTGQLNSPFSSGYGGLSSYASPYSSYSSYSPYGGGGLGGYGAFPYSGGYGYGGYPGRALPYGQDDPNFVQVAEQSSRQAFQSIENIVQAFSSVAMMLESSLTALYTSFRAVLGVADNFSRLKAHLHHVLTTLFVIKTLRYLWRKLLVLLRLRPHAFADEVWESATSAGTVATTNLSAGDILPGSDGKATGTNWPLVLFAAVAIGGPWLIWKLVSKIVANVEASKKWATGEETYFSAVALYDFRASSSNELSFSVGTEIRVAPKERQPAVRGWLLGSVDGQSIGLVPANYVRILGKRKGGEFVRTQTDEQRAALREEEMQRMFEDGGADKWPTS